LTRNPRAVGGGCFAAPPEWSVHSIRAPFSAMSGRACDLLKEALGSGPKQRVTIFGTHASLEGIFEEDIPKPAFADPQSGFTLHIVSTERYHFQMGSKDDGAFRDLEPPFDYLIGEPGTRKQEPLNTVCDDDLREAT